MSRAVMQQALEALVTCCAEEWRTLNNFGMKQVYDEKKVNAAVAALHAALAEPDYWQEEARRYAGNADYWRKRYEALAEPRPIQECYGDCPTNPQTCPNPCNFEGRPKPEQEPQTTHWEGCEAVHPECRKPEQEPDGISWLKRDSGYFTAPTPRKPEQPYDQTALDLCAVCGWRTLIPSDACLNCERSKQPEQEPEQQPVAHSVVEPLRPDEYQCRVSVKWVGQPVSGPLYTAPTPRKPQREHITDGSPCWCNPDVIEEDGGNVIVHNYEDNWQQYAKPGETAQQCIERHRAEQDALMKLYATPRKPQTTHWEGCEAVHPECKEKNT